MEGLATGLAGLIESPVSRLEGVADETKQYLLLVANMTRWLEEKGPRKIVDTGGFRR